MDKEIIIYTYTDNPEIQKTKKIIKPKFKQVFKVKQGDFKKNGCSCGCKNKTKKS